MSKRDDIIARNKMAEFYAVMSGRPALHTKPVPELKERKERAPSMEPSEYAIQKAVVGWWNLQCKVYGLPRFALFSVPNGSLAVGFGGRVVFELLASRAGCRSFLFATVPSEVAAFRFCPTDALGSSFSCVGVGSYCCCRL